MTTSIENKNFTTGEFEFELGKYNLDDIRRFVGDSLYPKLTDEDLEKFKDIIFYDLDNLVANAFLDYLQNKY